MAAPPGGWQPPHAYDQAAQPAPFETWQPAPAPPSGPGFRAQYPPRSPNLEGWPPPPNQPWLSGTHAGDAPPSAPAPSGWPAPINPDLPASQPQQQAPDPPAPWQPHGMSFHPAQPPELAHAPPESEPVNRNGWMTTRQWHPHGQYGEPPPAPEPAPRPPPQSVAPSWIWRSDPVVPPAPPSFDTWHPPPPSVHPAAIPPPAGPQTQTQNRAPLPTPADTPRSSMEPAQGLAVGLGLSPSPITAGVGRLDGERLPAPSPPTNALHVSPRHSWQSPGQRLSSPPSARSRPSGPGPRGPRGPGGSISERCDSPTPLRAPAPRGPRRPTSISQASEAWLPPIESEVCLPPIEDTGGGDIGSRVDSRVVALEAELAEVRGRLKDFERDAAASKRSEHARQWNSVLVTKYGRNADLLPMGDILPHVKRAADVESFNTKELIIRIEDLGGAPADESDDDLLRIYLLSLLGVVALPPVRLEMAP